MKQKTRPTTAPMQQAPPLSALLAAVEPLALAARAQADSLLRTIKTSVAAGITEAGIAKVKESAANWHAMADAADAAIRKARGT